MRRRKLLASTRPSIHVSRISKTPSNTALHTSKPVPQTLSSKKGATLIRTFHTLRKQHAAALAAGQHASATSLETQLSALGGLEAYQHASLNGQKSERGGDSSRVLVGWLTELGPAPEEKMEPPPPTIRVLEVGCLSPHNAISKFPHAQMTRIDLHSQHSSIVQQDFMERPLPGGQEERFHVLSLSLVLNYVPDAAGKGEMLRRTCAFLRRCGRRRSASEDGGGENADPRYPCLFLVLPAPCVYNSRYMTEGHLGAIMGSLGYRLLRQKVSSKLTYTLWRWDGPPEGKEQTFGKKELRPGGARNNFCVVLK